MATSFSQSKSQVEMSCPVCGGSGWRPEAVGMERPKVVPCECRATANFDRLLLRAGIPKRFAGNSFSDFRDDLGDEHMRESLSLARGAARRFAKDYPALTRTGLLFCGKCGTGKTHLSVAMAKELMQKGVDVYYCNVTDFLGQVRHSYNAATQTTPQEVLDRALEAEVLILDDLGAERLTDWVQETMYHVINQRYERGYGALIVTTNHDFAPPIPKQEATSQLGEDKRKLQAKRAAQEEPLGDRVGGRIYSRLQELCKVVLIYAEDYRERIVKR